jgi:hypothetical protein
MSAQNTVFGVIMDVTGNPVINAELLIRPAVTGPAGMVGGVIAPGDLHLFTNPAGFFTSGLIPGNYYLWVNRSGRSRFTMPSTPGAYLLQDLLGAQGMVPNAGINYRYLGGQLQLLGSDGNWYVPQIQVNPLALGFGVFDPTLVAAANYQTRGLMLEFIGADLQFRAPFLSGPDSAPIFSFAQPGAAPFQNYRIQNGAGALQILNVTTNLWRTIFLNNNAIAFGPPTA